MIRKAIFMAGAAALAPAILAGVALAEPGEASQSAFTPPDEPQVLTRTVRRSLSRGAEIFVRRSYRITFVRDGEGYRVDGELIGVEVDAPQSVRAIAELERNRQDPGLFPIHLDGLGRIVSQSLQGTEPAVAQGVQIAVTRINNSSLNSAEQRDALSLVRQAELQGNRISWPQDLFNPQPGTRTEVRKVPLPQGGEGEVSISIEARNDPLHRYLGSIDRIVVTRFENTERLAQESWIMRPLPQASLAPLR